MLNHRPHLPVHIDRLLRQHPTLREYRPQVTAAVVEVFGVGVTGDLVRVEVEVDAARA
jgi:hypothetical protein